MVEHTHTHTQAANNTNNNNNSHDVEGPPCREHHGRREQGRRERVEVVLLEAKVGEEVRVLDQVPQNALAKGPVPERVVRVQHALHTRVNDARTSGCGGWVGRGVGEGGIGDKRT